MLERPENPENMIMDELMHLAEGWISYNIPRSIFYFFFKNSTVFCDLLRKKRLKIMGYLVFGGSIILPFKSD